MQIKHQYPWSGKPVDMAMAFDWNSTLGRPGIKESFFRKYGLISKEQFDQDWAQHLNNRQGRAGDMGPLDDNPLEYLHRRMLDGSLQCPNYEPTSPPMQRADGGPLNGAFSIEDMSNFGLKGEVYQGVEEMFLRLMHKAWEEQGARLAVAVVTNAWAPIIRSTPIAQRNVVELVVGQEWEDQMVNGRAVARPIGQVNAQTKPASLVRVAKHFNVDLSNIVYVGNGYSDRPAFHYIKKMGGMAAGVLSADRNNLPPGSELTPKQQKHEAEDRLVLSRLREQGVLDFVVEARYTEGSVTEQAFARAAFELSQRPPRALSTPTARERQATVFRNNHASNREQGLAS